MVEPLQINFPAQKKQRVSDTYCEMGPLPKDALYVCAPVTTKSDLSSDFANTHISVVKQENLRHTYAHLNWLVQSGSITASLLIPGLLGERSSEESDWDEVDYNSFLFLCWFRIEKKYSEKFVSAIALNDGDRRAMSLYDQAADRRRIFYDIFRQKTVLAAQTFGYDPLPILVLPRWQISLGCTLEVAIAQELNIPTTFALQTENGYELSSTV